MRAGIVGFAGDDAADAAAGGGVVAGAPGNQVEMAVENGLAGIGSVVRTEVESGDGGVGGLEVVRQFAGETMGGGDFLWRQFAEGGHMASGDDQGVPITHGESVAEGDAGAVFGDDSICGKLAEYAGFVHI